MLVLLVVGVSGDVLSAFFVADGSLSYVGSGAESQIHSEKT